MGVFHLAEVVIDNKGVADRKRSGGQVGGFYIYRSACSCLVVFDHACR